jgi:hypothetical protein
MIMTVGTATAGAGIAAMTHHEKNHGRGFQPGEMP